MEQEQDIIEGNTGKFIVAEVTKNWTPGTPINGLLSQKFELVINTNAHRGYRLIDWKMNTIHYNDILTETIIAIFEKNSLNQNK